MRRDSGASITTQPSPSRSKPNCHATAESSLDDFDDATFVGTIKECGHKFCVRCVTTHVHKTMVNGHVLCPLCRTAFNPRSVRKARQVV